MGSKNNSSCISLNLDICNSDNKFLVDSGAEVSLLKENCLKTGVQVTKETCYLKGISEEKIQTLGICEAFIAFKDNEIISHKFYIVNKDFPIPDSGLVGRDFLFRHKVDIFYSKNLLTLYTNNNSIVNLDLIVKSEVLGQNEHTNKSELSNNTKNNTKNNNKIGSTVGQIKSKKPVVLPHQPGRKWLFKFKRQ